MGESRIETLHTFYEENKDFHDYVDRYCAKYVEGKSIAVQEALTHKMVKQYAEYVKERGNSDERIIP